MIIECLNDFIELFFPTTCVSCRKALVKGESFLCLNCESELPKQRLAPNQASPIEKRLWGRLPISGAKSLFNFEQGGAVQNLISQLKYKGGKDLAQFLGSQIDLRNEAWAQNKMLVPVPLHPKKKKLRGYNQSEEIAKGMATKNGLLVAPVVERIINTQSQTRKNQIDRWKNVSKAFRVIDKERVKGGSFILVDDVFTTGSTIEACGQKLIEAGAQSLSVVTLAVASH